MTLPKLALHGLDTVQHGRRVAESINNILDHSADDWRRQTKAEMEADVLPQNTAFPPGDIRRYGAGEAETPTNNVAAIKRAISANDWVLIPIRVEVNAAVALHSDLEIEFQGVGEMVMSAGVTTEYMVTGNAVSNIVIWSPKITGNGEPGLSSVRLVDCQNVRIIGGSITKAGAMALLLFSCSNVRVRECELSDNYFYGIDDRDGIANRYVENRFSLNGNTGVASNAGGRGINLWRCNDCVVAFNRFVASTEYGFRIYSEAADSLASTGNRIVSNFFLDNERADLVLYDESLAGSLVLENIVSGNIAIRSTNPGLDCSFLLHGGNNDITDNHVYKEGVHGDFVAFATYYGINQRIKDCSAHNLRDALQFSNSEDCVVDNMEGVGVGSVAGAAGIVGQRNVIKNSRFTHGGAGTSDVGIVNYNATGRNTIDRCTLDGFDIGIYIGEEAVTLTGNKTLNSTTAGIRKDGDGQAGQELVGNIWDSANPALMQFLDRKAAGTAVLYATNAPAARTWAVGDRTYNSAPAAGQPKSWVCTVAGTPGTHTSEGNL